MPHLKNTYGKGRVRVMRLHRDGKHHEVRETMIKVLLVGDFDRSFTDGDNSKSVATDSIKNVVNIVARENLGLNKEQFGLAIATKFLDRYEQIERVNIETIETKWNRLSIDGKPHGHSFTMDGNGNPVARLGVSRQGKQIVSGVEGFTFMKTTESGWVDYVMDEYTTLAETTDRIAATSMNATWTYAREPRDYEASNETIMRAMMRVFATTYSKGVQDSMYRMANAALAAMPDISQVSMAMPNKHYIPINLTPFKLDNPNAVFVPIDEPHGQIECTVERD